MVKISVIIPIYNVAPYVERCLRSVIAQTYTNIECILVDDCTPDNSMDICNRIISAYTGPIVFISLRHEHNRGLSAARNTGTDAATGEYIYYLDSDDELSPDCLYALEQEVEHHPGIDLVQGAIISIPYREYYDLSILKHSFYIKSNNWICYNFLRFGENFPVNAWNKLIKKDLITINHITFEEGLIHEDQLWTLQLVRKTQGVAIVGKPTYIHHITGNSIMSTTSNYKSAVNWMYIITYALKKIDEPFIQLQLYKYLWILLDRIEYVYLTKKGVLAIETSFLALSRYGHKKLAIRCLKYYFSLFIPSKRCRSSIKNNVALRWEQESIRCADSIII